MKYAQILSFLTFFAASTAQAAPVLLTVSETNQGQTQAWWPNSPGTDKSMRDAFERQGIALLHPEEIKDAPRLSPVVYGQKKLSNDNARTMASLFGAQNVLNGNIAWNCSSMNDKVMCAADADMTLLYDKSKTLPIRIRTSASAPSENMAMQLALSQVVTQTVLPVISHTAVVKDDIPALSDKPVIVFDSLPDADTLVALRKQLKRVAGVEDVAERWAANGSLAIEINPAQATMSQSEFLLIVQGFMNGSTENLVIRQTRQTENAAVFEVVKF